jgi:peptidoglycan/xylan/chitin deacetylase (PgdA/CDA1 family)
MLTFDDGYRGTQQYALPILKKYNIKATLFVVTGFLGNLSFLTWDQLDEIANSELITLASHTNKLHYYKQYNSFAINYPAMLRFKIENESLNTYQTRVQNDLLLSKKLLETRYPNKKINYLAYPFGAYNQEVVDVVRKAGFNMAFAYDSKQTKWMSRDSNPFLLERYPIFQYSTNKDLFREER